MVPTKKPIETLFIFFTILFLALISHLLYIQVMKGDALAKDTRNRRVIQREATAQRGRIFDRNGILLAETDDSRKRYYPKGALFAHVVGYADSVYGKSGLEASFNKELIGAPGNFFEKISETLWGKGQVGNDLVLTLDAALQQVAYDALGSRQGAVVAVNPQNGDILAVVSRPGFEPNNLQRDWARLLEDGGAPFLNRVTQGLYPPGSVIKPLLAVAALESQTLKDGETFLCQGRTIIDGYAISCDKEKAHGQLTLSEALVVSCNVSFAHLGDRLGEEVFYEYIEKLLLTQALELPLPTVAGRFPVENPKRADLVENSIGQGKALVTPLHMAMMAATIGNHGVMMKPRLISVVKTREGRRLASSEAEVLVSPISLSVARKVTEMMVEAVNSGTAKGAKIEGISVAGKTGTADNPGGEAHGWFIGFAPAERPRIAVAVIVENGGYGGVVAAPIGQKVMSQALKPFIMR